MGDQFRSHSQEEGLTLRNHQKPADALDALATMNLVLGSSAMLLAQEKFVEERQRRGERVDPLIAGPVLGGPAPAKPIIEKVLAEADPSRRVGIQSGEGAWLVVWEADKAPSLLLTRLPASQPILLSSPLQLDLLPRPWLQTRLIHLARKLIEMPTIQSTPVYSVLGPKILVDLFVPVWSKITDAMPRYENPLVSYKLLSSSVGEVPPPMSLSEGFTVRLANKDDDYRALAALFQSFSKTTSYPIDSYSAQALTRLSVEQHRVWIFVNTSQTLPGLSLIAGYLLLARETPRSVSISQLYTGRDYRGRGVGEALVRKCVPLYQFSPSYTR
jgi:hypothetical protein